MNFSALKQAVEAAKLDHWSRSEKCTKSNGHHFELWTIWPEGGGLRFDLLKCMYCGYAKPPS